MPPLSVDKNQELKKLVLVANLKQIRDWASQNGGDRIEVKYDSSVQCTPGGTRACYSISIRDGDEKVIASMQMTQGIGAKRCNGLAQEAESKVVFLGSKDSDQELPEFKQDASLIIPANIVKEEPEVDSLSQATFN